MTMNSQWPPAVEDLLDICEGVNQPLPTRPNDPDRVARIRRSLMRRARAARLCDLPEDKKRVAYTNLRFGTPSGLTRAQAAAVLGVTSADTYQWDPPNRSRWARLNFVKYRRLLLEGRGRRQAAALCGVSLRTTYRWCPADDPYGDRRAGADAGRFRADYLISRTEWGYEMREAAAFYGVPVALARQWDREVGLERSEQRC